MCDPIRLKQLEDENCELKQSIAIIKAELVLLKTHLILLAGLRGETIVCDLVGGKLTSFAESYDIEAGQCKIEVKFSNLGFPVRGHATQRWSWSKPLGWKDKGKSYDYLILLGEKDLRFPSQYLDTGPYACFFIPRPEVEALMFKGASIGGIIQITTNFKHVTAKQSMMLLRYLTKLDDILALTDPARSEKNRLAAQSLSLTPVS